jgi:hypothetical protein
MGRYRVAARLNKLAKSAVLQLMIGNTKLQKEIAAGTESAAFDNVKLPRGSGRLQCYVWQDGNMIGVRDLEVTHLR